MPERQDTREFYKAAQCLIEFDALGSYLDSIEVLLSDSLCKVRACRMYSLSNR